MMMPTRHCGTVLRQRNALLRRCQWLRRMRHRQRRLQHLKRRKRRSLQVRVIPDLICSWRTGDPRMTRERSANDPWASPGQAMGEPRTSPGRPPGQPGRPPPKSAKRSPEVISHRGRATAQWRLRSHGRGCSARRISGHTNFVKIAGFLGVFCIDPPAVGTILRIWPEGGQHPIFFAFSLRARPSNCHRRTCRSVRRWCF